MSGATGAAVCPACSAGQYSDHNGGWGGGGGLMCPKPVLMFLIMNRNHTIAQDHEHEPSTGEINNDLNITLTSLPPPIPLNASQMLKVSICKLKFGSYKTEVSMQLNSITC
jgi:hypothetical protein